MTESTKPILSLKNVSIAFKDQNTSNTVVKDISFELFTNEILGIVGESGSGKSVTSLAILGLLPKTKSTTTGIIHFDNDDLLTLQERELRALRGKAISMIFQEPMSSLNPSLTCGYQVVEILKQHLKLSYKEAKTETLSLFDKVKLPRPEAIFSSYPHQISGGQKQRVMIAMAIACKPKILIADEPTTALDVTVQKDIIVLLKELQQETGMSIIFISHDLSLVSEIANRVIVMYKGEVVESAFAKAIFKNPQHTYTKALISARPSLKVRLKTLPTISDFLNQTPQSEVVSDTDREGKHKKMYEQPPLLVVKNVSKTYYSNGGLFASRKAVKAVKITLS